VKVVRLPEVTTVGITNRTEDGYFVLFLDYDKVEYNVVRDDIDFLQKNYDIGTVITRITSSYNYKGDVEVGNYHVVAFTKFTFPEIKEMLRLTRCDDHFKVAYRYQQRCWVLRIGEKIDENGNIVKPFTLLREIVPFKTKRVANRGFIEFFEKLDGVQLKKYFGKNIDNYTKIELIHYVTKR